MTIFGPINDLFSSKEDRAKLLESRNIQLARLDAFSKNENQFNTSVAQAKQSLQDQKNTNAIVKNYNTPQPQSLAEQTPNSNPITPQEIPTQPLASNNIPPQQPLASKDTKPLSPQEENRIRTVAENLNAPQTNPSSTPPETPQHSTLSQTLDVLNPLQHIPFVNLAYREITGDTISPASKVIGGTLFGGLIGGVGAIAGAGAAVGFTSGLADASFTRTSGMETSTAAAKLYHGEPFDPNDENTTTADAKDTLSDASASPTHEKTFTPTFDARHVYADVLRKFGTDIDVLLAHNPDTYGAQVVYANAIAHVDSLSPQQLAAAQKPEDASSAQEKLALLHASLPTASANANPQTTFSKAQPLASLYQKSSPLIIKDDALQRLAAIRQNLNTTSPQSSSPQTETSPTSSPLASTTSPNAISSLIERRLNQLIDAKEKGTISSLPPAQNPTTSASENPLHTIPSQSHNPASPSPQALAPNTIPLQNNVADTMAQRLAQFNERREQQIYNSSENHVVTSNPIPQKPTQNTSPEKVSQAPAQDNVQPERLASAMRDAFSRFSKNLISRN